jgi:hypothetical protein
MLDCSGEEVQVVEKGSQATFTDDGTRVFLGYFLHSLKELSERVIDGKQGEHTLNVCSVKSMYDISTSMLQRTGMAPW